MRQSHRAKHIIAEHAGLARAPYMSKPDVFPSGSSTCIGGGRSRRQEFPGKLGMGGVIGLDLPVPQWVSSTVLGPHIQWLRDTEPPGEARNIVLTNGPRNPLGGGDNVGIWTHI